MKDKAFVIEELKKTPIIQLVCQRVGIGRATYYRWKKEDLKFARQADEALADGIKLMNDLAESKLLSLIKDGNMTGIIFWLKNRHPAYTTRVEITTNQSERRDVLNEKEQELLTKALAMAKLIPDKQEGGKAI